MSFIRVLFVSALALGSAQPQTPPASLDGIDPVVIRPGQGGHQEVDLSVARAVRIPVLDRGDQGGVEKRRNTKYSRRRVREMGGATGIPRTTPSSTAGSTPGPTTATSSSRRHGLRREARLGHALDAKASSRDALIERAVADRGAAKLDAIKTYIESSSQIQKIPPATCR
jgi:hypothetical protein